MLGRHLGNHEYFATAISVPEERFLPEVVAARELADVLRLLEPVQRLRDPHLQTKLKIKLMVKR
jgi:hypothetical protein